MSEERIRDDRGYLTALGEALGRERLEQFVNRTAGVQAQLMFLTMAVAAVPGTGYNDLAIDNMVTDARDLLQAARELARFAEDLALGWQRQRRGAEARGEL